MLLVEKEKLIKIKNKYLEVRMHNEDVEDPQSMLNSKLAIRAGEKIQELRK